MFLEVQRRVRKLCKILLACFEFYLGSKETAYVLRNLLQPDRRDKESR